MKPRRKTLRKGVAATETAIVAPLFVALFLGAVDVGQFANCYQKVIDASREGARAAVRYGESDVTNVEDAVYAYLGDMFPNVGESTLRSNVIVKVTGPSGTITGTNLGSMSTGSQVEVEVIMPFSLVRWISGFQILGGYDLQATTAMRRE